MQDYPLYPYLLYQDLKRRIAKVPDDQIIAFLHDYRDTPIADHLRYKWLRNRARRGRWGTVINHYVPSSSISDKTVDCLYADALLRSERTDLAQEVTLNLWRVKFSQEAACDDAFKRAKKLKMIGEQEVWERILLVLRGRKLGLADYLSRSLSPALKKEYRRLRKAYRNPMGTLSSIDYQRLSSPYYRDLLLYALQRAQRKDPHRVLAIWKNRLAQALKDYPDFAYRVQHDLGLGAAQKLESQIAYDYLSALPQSAQTTESHFWLIRSTLRLRKWDAAIKAIDQLDSPLRSYPQWQYWKARALDLTGRKDLAVEIWKSLAKRNDYYGYLSADKIGAPYRFVPTIPRQAASKDPSDIALRDDVMRVRELLLLGRTFPARREMHALVNRLSIGQRIQLAELTERWQWSSGTVQAMASDTLRNETNLRFPVPFRELVQQRARKSKIPEHWLYGVMRRESAFMPEIRSPAGALGLMQLMPRTAASVARSLRLKKPSKISLLNPRLNLQLGATYLKKLYQKYDSRLPLALAGYNAGPSRVRRWLKRTPTQDADIWVDTIPINETRLYVRAVLFYITIYQYKLQSQTDRLSTLLKI